MSYSHLEGRRFCLVFAKAGEQDPEKVQLRCHYGRLNIQDGDKLYLQEDSGAAIGIPSSACNKILPSDGTHLLKDAEYFVIVTLGAGVEF